MRWPSALFLLAAIGSRAGAGETDRVARLASAERTIEMVAAKSQEYRARLAARVHAYIKVERPGAGRLWVESSRARMDWLARRAGMTRLLRRDLAEMAVLRAERDAAVAARDRSRGELAVPEPEPPERGSLVRPIARARLLAGFGLERHRESGADLSARGIDLAARSGDPVMAVADGRVLWTGRLQGGAAGAVLVDHGAFVSVLVGFGRTGVTPGQPVSAGQVLGQAAGEELHLEIRLRSGAFGTPVDPAPLLAR